MRFGKLTVTGRHDNDPRLSHSKWAVSCECGRTKIVAYYDLLRTDTRAARHCGCVRWENRKKHGFATRALKSQGYSPEYRCWMVMRSRCTNPNVAFYYRYGGRGIRVCSRWDFFENFLADMGPKPGPHFTIERKDHNGHYEPDNCVWLHRSQQGSNTCRTHTLTIGGQSKTLADWSRISGRPATTILQRIRRGWSTYRAVFDEPRW